MAAIAATTPRIRIGSAGVMLPHYSALKVAEQFRVLEAIAPGRIDLGVGRAPGSDRLTALRAQSARERRRRFPAAGARAAGLGRRRAARQTAIRFAAITAHPTGPDEPGAVDPRQLRLRRAARGAFRAAVCVRVFLQRGPRRRGSARALPAQLPSERALSGAAGDDLRVGARGRYRSGSAPPSADARILARRVRAGACASRWSRRTTPPTYPYTQAERATIEALRRKAIVGTGEAVAGRLTELAQRLQLDELVVVTWTHDPQARHRSYELLARAFGLTAA